MPEEGFDEGSRAVYGEWLLWRTKMLLPAVIRLPGDIPVLVQDAYRWDGDDALPGTEESARALQAYRSARQDMQARAQTHVIARPKISRYPRRNVLDNWMHEESAHFEAQARAAVRDGEPSVEVLVMMRRRDGTVCFPSVAGTGRLRPDGQAALAAGEPQDRQAAPAAARVFQPPLDH